MGEGGGGSGPGDHPGVTIVTLTSDVQQTADAVEVALEGGRNLLLVYSVGGQPFAVFASDYK